MRILGLTGDIACGKSTVAHLLQERGAAVLDSDLLVRELYARKDFAVQVQELFEAPILNEECGIDRGKLGQLVFNNAPGLKQLEALVFPAVGTLREEKIRSLEALGQNVVIIEAVKLLESGQGHICNEIWCVVCAPEVQLIRMVENRGLTREGALARLRSQPSRAAKTELAGQVPLVWVENDGTLSELAAQVERHWKKFLA